MIKSALVKSTLPIAYLEFSKSKIKEKYIGYRIKFHNVSDKWLSNTMMFDMTRTWRKFGLPAIGLNYFTIGNIENKKTTRFDYRSDCFQSWLGCYIAKLKNHKEWSLDDHFKLAVADQKGWLQTYGKRDPFVEIDYGSIKNLGSIKIGNYKGNLFQGSIFSNTDVGEGQKPFYFPFIMESFAYMLRKDNKISKVDAFNLFPSLNNDYALEPFQKIELKGYVAIVDLSDTQKAVFYGNGTYFTDNKGEKRDSFLKIKDEIMHVMESAEIIKV